MGPIPWGAGGGVAGPGAYINLIKFIYIYMYDIYIYILYVYDIDICACMYVM